MKSVPIEPPVGLKRERLNRYLVKYGYSDINPFPRFHLFGRRKQAQPPRCTGDPCICTNGIGCVTIPMELW